MCIGFCFIPDNVSLLLLNVSAVLRQNTNDEIIIEKVVVIAFVNFYLSGREREKRESLSDGMLDDASILT